MTSIRTLRLPTTPGRAMEEEPIQSEHEYRHNPKHPFNMLVPDGGLPDSEKLAGLKAKMVHQVGGAFSCVLAVLGDKLGLYKALDGAGPMTAAQLAEKTGMAERYMQEWLSGQATAGWVDYNAHDETFSLSSEQSALLARDDSPSSLIGLMELAVGLAGHFTREDGLSDAFRDGGGLGWSEQPLGVVRGIARATATEYEDKLLDEWLPELSVKAQLALFNGSAVADIGCGFGATTVLMARAYPRSKFFGYDRHELSIRQARKIARGAQITGNLKFEVATAKNFPCQGYSLVTCFDALHDMGDPVGAAKHAYDALEDGGSWLIVEHSAGGHLSENLHNPMSPILYSVSCMVCVPNALSQADGRAAWGACAGEKRVRDTVLKVGFREFKHLATTERHIVLEAIK